MGHSGAWVLCALNAAILDSSRSPISITAVAGGKVIGCRRSEEHTSELQSQPNLVCRLLLEKTNRRRRPVTTLASSAFGGSRPVNVGCEAPRASAARGPPPRRAATPSAPPRPRPLSLSLGLS